MNGMNGFSICVRVRETRRNEINRPNQTQRKDQITIHTLHIVNKDKKKQRVTDVKDMNRVKG